MKSKHLLLSIVFCTIYLCSNFRGHAEASIFQQATPTSQPASPYSSSFNESNSSYNFNNLLQRQRGAHNNQRTQDVDRSQTVQTRDYFTRNSPSIRQDDSDSSCPQECLCNRQTQTVDCSNRNLLEVPKGFPRDTKRIRLERNNITEVGPYAFQGLKRLQRIDLSNNNLARIDPLAFAGGLQSLNSLILYSNKLNQLPVNLFSELSQLQLLLLNANSLQCINKELFQPLSNLNLLSLYDNSIETLANGTFDGLKNIKTIHLGKNPLICDCNLRWLVEYLEANSSVETSEARCEAPARNQGKKISQLGKQFKIRCEPASDISRTLQIQSQCGAISGSTATVGGAAAVAAAVGAAAAGPGVANSLPPSQPADQACPAGCECNGSTVDCSRASKTESRPAGSNGGDLYELPDIPDDIPLHVIRMHINDTRIKRIRQTGLFRRLANAQKLDLGNNRIIDIEDNAISNSGAVVGPTAAAGKPERVVFVLLENDQCSAPARGSSSSGGGDGGAGAIATSPARSEDACSLAPRVVADSPCFNGGSCFSASTLSGGSGQPSQAARMAGHHHESSNYSCLCPPGFGGSLCEINIDDCADHQCQNGAMCVDGVNSYKCICRDPTTTGEFCEQLNSYSTSSANSIAPMALPIISPLGGHGSQLLDTPPQQQQQQHHQQQILARSADLSRSPIVLNYNAQNCKRITQKRHYEDGNGCQSVRMLKMSECVGSCGTKRNSSSSKGGSSSSSSSSCCFPAKVKRRRVRMQCNDGASYVKTVDLIKRCSCSSECSSNEDLAALPDWASSQQQQNSLTGPIFNATQEDQLLQITRLDAAD